MKWLAARRARDVEGFDGLFEARADASTHLIFFEILLRRVLMVSLVDQTDLITGGVAAAARHDLA